MQCSFTSEFSPKRNAFKSAELSSLRKSTEIVYISPDKSSFHDHYRIVVVGSPRAAVREVVKVRTVAAVRERRARTYIARTVSRLRNSVDVSLTVNSSSHCQVAISLLEHVEGLTTTMVR